MKFHVSFLRRGHYCRNPLVCKHKLATVGATPRESGRNPMRKFLSTVADVFQISGHGCVVVPGIPRSTDARVRVGDPVWLDRPDGSVVLTAVHGIEIGGPLNSPGIPIVLGSDLLKDDVPIGTRLLLEFIPAGRLTLIGRSSFGVPQVEQLLQTDDAGHLRLGNTGRSLSVATVVDVQEHSIEFMDYLMEGFLAFHMKVVVQGDSLAITIELHGTNRDRYLQPHVAHCLKQAGFSV